MAQRNGKKYFSLVCFLLTIISVSLALAAGGGGGGGGGSGGSGGGGGGGPLFTALACDDRGVLSFQQSPSIKPVVVETSAGTNLTIAGEWNGILFTSDEAELREAGTYTLRDPVNGDKTVECSGLKFSCKLVELSLKACSRKEGKVQAEFSLINAAAADLSYQFSLPGMGRTLNYQQDSHSTELKDLKVIRRGSDAYQLDASVSLDVSQLLVSVPRCVGRYYTYTKIDCTEEQQEGQQDPALEQQGKILKCGGYLEVADRVKCRLDLREDQADEYENFFPEECRSWADQEACLVLYKSVQPCWKLEEQVRVSCLREKVGLASVSEEQSACAGNAACLAAVRKKVHTLIKLRLYNLEEKAEEFLEDGTLTKEEITDFVIRMEQSKLAFNRAQSKSERRAVIVQARQHWIELMKKVGP